MAHEHLKWVKKTINYIYIQGIDWNWIPNGTWFFVGVKNQKNPDMLFTYLVSAKHVFYDEYGNIHNKILVRLNKTDGTIWEEIVDLTKIVIHTHTDQSVDIALFECSIDSNKYDFMIIQDDLFATKQIVQENGICEWDDMFFAWLFINYLGSQKNYPLLRFWKVALMPDEKILITQKNKNLDWTDKFITEMKDLYLMECNSIGGHSWSPVFFQLNWHRDLDQITIWPWSVRMFLAWIMSWRFNDTSAWNGENSGIAYITPAYLLNEILLNEELAKRREKATQ